MNQAESEGGRGESVRDTRRREKIDLDYKASPFELSSDHFLVKGQDLWPLSEGGISSPGQTKRI